MKDIFTSILIMLLNWGLATAAMYFNLTGPGSYLLLFSSALGFIGGLIQIPTIINFKNKSNGA